MTPAVDRVEFDGNGLVPVVAQDAATGDVLTLAYASREAVELTLASGEAHYYSRSRSELWRKGATSGNTQRVVEVRLDCDGDALLYMVEPRGPACHTGEKSCFFTSLTGEGGGGGRRGRHRGALRREALRRGRRPHLPPTGAPGRAGRRHGRRGEGVA